MRTPIDPGFRVGDWVEVDPAHDIPPMFRDNKPTVGRVEDIYDDPTPGAGEAYVGVLVPIGDEDPDEHSQYVPYPLSALTRIEHA